MKPNFTKSIIIASLAIIGLSNTSNAQIITTIAGNGTQGYTGDGGLATSAEIDQNGSRNGIAKDAAGNIYIADNGNSRIRKITASTGIISTFAGTGTQGYSGDGGLATSAELNYPTAVFADASGNVYISEDSRIRKVSASTGIISTVAGITSYGYSGDGGLATSAQLYGPSGVVVDDSGNVYIADQANYRIRKVSAFTGFISTIAGNGTGGGSGDGGLAVNAKISNVHGISIDVFGNIYIADYGNSRIRKITVSTGIISTIAGGGISGLGDGGLATSAQLGGASGVCVDGSGNVYIADVLNYRIRKVTASTGIISTIAGNGTYGYSGDGGLATSAELKLTGVFADVSGDVYIQDTNNNRIRKISSTTTGITEENNFANQITVYPNPATTSITITNIPEKATLKLVDIPGNVVYENTTEKGLGSEISINTSNLAQGIYTLVTESNAGRAVNKIVINK